MSRPTESHDEWFAGFHVHDTNPADAQYATPDQVRKACEILGWSATEPIDETCGLWLVKVDLDALAEIHREGYIERQAKIGDDQIDVIIELP